LPRRKKLKVGSTLSVQTIVATRFAASDSRKQSYFLGR